MKSSLLFPVLCLICLPVWAQPGVPSDQIPTDSDTHWHHDDPEQGQYQGVSTEKAYQALKEKKSKTVVVAVIDSGVDIEHEDLKDKIWTNTDEIPDNNIDDDGNGFIDDVYGWNFIGNADGENIIHETLEKTRIYRKYKNKYEGVDASAVPADELDTYNMYYKAKAEFLEEKESAQTQKEELDNLAENFMLIKQILADELGKEDFTLDEVKEIESDDSKVSRAKLAYTFLTKSGFEESYIAEGQKYYSNRVKYHLNENYNPREIIGDDQELLDYGKYGNPDVIGGKENAEHGTHVAGIIGATRGNNKGIDGIADDILIMAIRCVPDGDERDKDVANSIRYAVDNGADIINMSFGKYYSLQPHFVIEAVKYAEEKGVLLVHGSGNEASDVDEVINYPNDYGGGSSTYLNVGANSKDYGKEFVANFSNYGDQNVDVFAPGVDVFSTLPGDTYGARSGTSMASPVAAGVAALVLSYYPDLSPNQLKEILMDSGVRHKKGKVKLPTESGGKKKTKFGKLSASGAVVNAYLAVQAAEKMSQSGASDSKAR